MKRVFSVVLGIIAASWFVGSTVPTAQVFPTPITQAIALLTTGVTTFSIVGIDASGYVNWGSGRGETGYGIRDNAGVIQFKGDGGSWTNLPSSGTAPDNATYITQTASAGLSAEQALSALGSALMVNTTGTGVLSAYAGTSCTNQFPRSLSALGAATCANVDLVADITGTLAVVSGGTGLATVTQGDLLFASAANTLLALAKDASATRYLSNTGASNNPAWAQIALATGVSGTLPVANGGTGLTSGTSGGVLAYTASGTLASSAALTANEIVTGGGAGVAPGPLGSLGTTTTVLHGNAAGAPTWGAVNLATDTTGSVTAATGGTGQTSYTIGALLMATGATTLSKLAASTLGTMLRSTGAGSAPVWSTTIWPNAATTGDVIYATGANTYGNLTAVAAGAYLRSAGVGAAPVWSTLILPNAATIGDLLMASSSNTLTALADVAVGQVLISGGVGVIPAWSATPTAASFTASTAFLGAGTVASVGALRLANNTTIRARDAGDTADITLLQSTAADRVSLGSAAATGLTFTGTGGSLIWETTVPTISSGFGTTPSIAGLASAFKVTVGSGGDTTGVVLFQTTWGTAPSCTANNETTAQLVRATPTTTQVTLAGTLGASDVLNVLCVGY